MSHVLADLVAIRGRGGTTLQAVELVEILRVHKLLQKIVDVVGAFVGVQEIRKIEAVNLLVLRI